MPHRRKSGTERTLIGPKKKIAFVCSGGASKAGAFHLGVALALQEQGFKFVGGPVPRLSGGPSNTPFVGTSLPMQISTYVGSSAGSIICSYLAAGYSLDTIFDSFLGKEDTLLPRLTYQKMFKLRPELAGETFGQIRGIRQLLGNVVQGEWESLFKGKWLKATGLFSTAGLEQYLREEVLVSNHFQDYLADLFIVATQLNHSRKVVFGKYSYQPPPHDVTCQYNNDVVISKACAASTALPFIFTPYSMPGPDGSPIYYIDGEIRDTLSTHVAIDSGADLVFASYTHQPYHWIRDIGSLTEYGLPAILIQSIYLLIEQKINHHIHNKKTQRQAIEAVHHYCRSQNIDEAHRKRICEILETELHHRLDVDTVYIHPSPADTQMFFGEHFSLSPKKMTEIVKSGFRAAIDVLRKYEFADRKRGPVTSQDGTPHS